MNSATWSLLKLHAYSGISAGRNVNDRKQKKYLLVSEHCVHPVVYAVSSEVSDSEAPYLPPPDRLSLCYRVTAAEK